MKKILSGDPTLATSYLPLVLRRSARVKSEIGILGWMKLTLLEFLFGEEILEQFTITASYNEAEKTKVGNLLHLSDMVPSGLLTNFFRNSLYQLLYYKFFCHYMFLSAETTIRPKDIETEDGASLDLTRDRFGVRHDMLYQIIAFRRVYVIAWVIFNVLVDILVWSLSDIQTALLSALSIEALRRLVKL